MLPWGKTNAISTTLTLIGSALLGISAAGITSANVQASESNGPTVVHLPSQTTCTVSVTSETAIETRNCDRLALDDAYTSAVIDETRREIRVRNNQAYGESTIIADVLLHGQGQRIGRSQPYLVHLVISKTGNSWHDRLSAYTLPGRGTPDDATIDAWTVIVEAPQKIILTPAKARAAIVAPSLSSRLSAAFAQANDIRTDHNRMPALEISVALGPISSRVARARLELPETIRQNPKQPLWPVLKREDWRFELESLSSLVPLDLIRHDLFLFGLSTHPLLKDVMRRGYRSGEKLTVGMRDGTGYVQLGQQSAPFPQAQQTAMTFLRDTYVGMVLADQGNLMESNKQ